MSALSTLTVDVFEARKILEDHLFDVLKASRRAGPQEMGDLLNVYVSQNDEQYELNNFSVVQKKEGES